MLRNRIYYSLKPMIPVSVRLAMRRVRARWVQRKCGDVWPIHDAGGRMPDGWPGWPEGRDFAFVLSHDVEGQRGVDRCRQLAEIEMEYGFRSSFNFIPSGNYEVSPDLRRWLVGNGFEVGVHDLRHDGRLFQSRESFQIHAKRINHYLREWGAVGFRAGFMLHRLDWLHDLNIEYDASTFDVDPFEAQPDAALTAFPFWVARPDPDADALRPPTQHRTAAGAGRGYIELPYTLVQDYNLFVVLQARGIEMWRRKLAWLAEKRAMAFLDTHPDYMAMAGGVRAATEFPVAYYRELLDHVRSDYAGRYWHALPREVAAYARGFQLAQARPPRRVAMLTHSYYDSDNRVRRYAETLVRRGDSVRVYCLGSEEQVATREWENLHGVEVFRLQSRTGAKTGKWTHAWHLARFCWRALTHLRPRSTDGRVDLLHVHNIPDFLVFAGLRLKFRGTAVILDIHDIVPELFEAKFHGGRGSLLSRALRTVERWSCGFADHVIVANHIWKQTLLERSATPDKVTALINNVDLDLFRPHPRTRTDGRIILLYPGSLNWHQGLDVAVDAMPALVREFPHVQLHLYSSGPSLPALKQQVERRGMTGHVHFFPPVLLDRIPGIMAEADIGIVPKRAEGFGDQAYSTKIMEFMSQGLPVVVSRTRIDRLYFDDSVAAFFESGNAADFARAVGSIIRDPQYRQQLSERGRKYAEANSWEQIKEIYLDLVDRLTMTGIPEASSGWPGWPGRVPDPARGSDDSAPEPRRDLEAAERG